MAHDSTTGSDQGLGQRMKQGLHSKVLVPAAATIVSAAVSYLIKKLPVLLEEKVLPKLQESGAPERVAKVAETASAAVGGGDGSRQRETEQPESAQQEQTDEQSGDGGSERARDADAPTAAERAEQRKEREQRRRERKRATNQAA